MHRRINVLGYIECLQCIYYYVRLEYKKFKFLTNFLLENWISPINFS